MRAGSVSAVTTTTTTTTRDGGTHPRDGGAGRGQARRGAMEGGAFRRARAQGEREINRALFDKMSPAIIAVSQHFYRGIAVTSQSPLKLL